MTAPDPESDREPTSPPVDEAALAVQRVQRKQAALLVLLGVIGVVAVMPYAFTLQRDQLAEVIKSTGASLFSLALVSCAQSAALVAVAVIGGLWAARQVGLTAPVTAALARGEPAWPELRRFLIVAIVVGLVAGALTAGLDAMVFLPRAPELRALSQKVILQPSLWKGALAGLYGAFTEELQVRLFFLSLLALGLGHLWRVIRGAKQLGRVPWAILLTANVLAALVFGLLHLPATAALVKLTPLLVMRALLLNGIVGLACGFLYLRRGLEAAMVAHLTADLVLHLAVPAFLRAGVLGL